MKKEPSFFSKKVWEIASSIPLGRVSTYGAIARAAGGAAQSARSVSRILSKAPNKTVIPWHRIVYADGRVWFSPEHEKKRRALYKKEGIEIDKKGRIKDFGDKIYLFN